MMKKNSNQILVINSLRGLAALAVCLYHFVFTTTGFIYNETILEIFHFGQRGVQLFFIISGIVIPLSMLKSEYKIKLMGKYLLKRFIRIEPPYLVAVAIGILYLYARNFVPSAAAIDMTPSLKDILLHIGYLVPFVEDAKWINPVFWTLSIEFQYYIFLALLFPLALSKKNILNWIFNLIVVILPFFMDSMNFYIHWSAYFGLGIFYALYISGKYNKWNFMITMLLCSIVVYIEQGIIDLFIAFATLGIIHYFPKFKTKAGLFLGKISYSLYLLHSIIGSAFINFMSHRVSSPEGKFIIILLGTIISIVSAYFFWKLIEKPSQLRAHKIQIKEVNKT